MYTWGDVMETKVCSKCKKEFDIRMFGKEKRNKDGIKGQCNSCIKEYRIANKEKSAKYKKEYCEKNKEKIAWQKKEWYKKNEPRISKLHKEYNDAHKEHHKKYREENKEHLKEVMKLWGINNHEKTRRTTQIKRARKKLLPCTLTLEQWEDIKNVFNNKCAYCGAKAPLEQDHFLAMRKGGEYTHNNIIPSCKSCNCSKGMKDFFEWYSTFKHYSKIREAKVLKYLNYNKNSNQQLALTL